MNIIFFGEDSFSAVVLDSLIKNGHRILHTYCPLYNNNIHARVENICKQHTIQFTRITDFSSEHFKNQVKTLSPDLIVVCHFQKLLPPSIIGIPAYGCINLHPSLLPYYRGMSPQHYPIINGDRETGITVHFIDTGIDTGDIIQQQKISIGDDEYVSDLQNRFKPIYATIMNDAIGMIKEGRFVRKVQKALKGSYYGKLRAGHCNINPDGSYKEAYNLIRAVSFPYYGARYKDLIIWKARPGDTSQGDIQQNNAELLLQFHDGILVVEKYEKQNN